MTREVIRAQFEARAKLDSPWIWEIWDITHAAECNHFVVATIDSRGASDDFHEEMAKVATEAFNRNWGALK